MSRQIINKHIVANALADIAPKFDISQVYLFGSCARGEATEKSDVDLCLETGPTFSLLSAAEFVDALKNTLGVEVNVVSESPVYPHVKNTMMKDRVARYERQ